MTNEIIYSSVREEILEQKKCQFQLFGLALTFSAGIFALSGAKENITPVLYLAPIIMNVIAMNLILSKATSIQRMVGYLQVMENDISGQTFKWEYHLNKFRENAPQKTIIEKWRKHNYIGNISLLLLTLSIASGILFVVESKIFSAFNSLYIIIFLFAAGLLLFGFIVFAKRMYAFIRGGFTSDAVREHWKKSIAACEG